MRISVSKAYGEKRVFENFALDIDEGEVLVLLGASGVGKTTLLNILADLTTFEGEKVGVPKQVGYCFQEPRLLKNLTVKGNLLYAGAREEEIDDVLREIGLLAHAHKLPSALSGGEKQRVAIARAFLSDAPLLLLDEPFSALDIRLKVRLWQTFARLWEQKRPTAVFVTHDIEEAWALGHRIVLLKNGRVAMDIRPERSAYPAPYGEYSEQKAKFIEEALKDGDDERQDG